MTLIKSISEFVEQLEESPRGTDALDIVKFTAAYAVFISTHLNNKEKKIVVGRDCPTFRQHGSSNCVRNSYGDGIRCSGLRDGYHTTTEVAVVGETLPVESSSPQATIRNNGTLLNS
jgi:hypothetical protein